MSEGFGALGATATPERSGRKPAREVVKESRVTYMYVAHPETGDPEYFSDELEAHRYAIKGAAKARVEKRELLKRTK